MSAPELDRLLPASPRSPGLFSQGKNVALNPEPPRAVLAAPRNLARQDVVQTKEVVPPLSAGYVILVVPTIRAERILTGVHSLFILLRTHHYFQA
jgi:hypothetical protein